MPRQTTERPSDQETAYFSAAADYWWANPAGSFQQLHKVNPLRISYVKEKVAAHFGRRTRGLLKGLTVLDVGCGGGLLAEPLAALGGQVTGLDFSAETIKVAQDHAKQRGLAIDYRTGTVENLAQTEAQFDIVLAMEVIEHVTDRASFFRAISKVLKPNGLLLMATINRTVKSYFLGIVMAEYVLGWVGEGMHDWDMFVRPLELTEELDAFGLMVTDLTGMPYDLLSGSFKLDPNALDVNYFLAARPMGSL